MAESFFGVARVSGIPVAANLISADKQHSSYGMSKQFVEYRSIWRIPLLIERCSEAATANRITHMRLLRHSYKSLYWRRSQRFICGRIFIDSHSLQRCEERINWRMSSDARLNIYIRRECDGNVIAIKNYANYRAHDISNCNPPYFGSRIRFRGPFLVTDNSIGPFNDIILNQQLYRYSLNRQR